MGSSRLEYVVDNYYHAITAMFPRCRYICGWDAILGYIPLTYLPTELEDGLIRLAMMRNKPILPAALEKQKHA